MSIDYLRQKTLFDPEEHGYVPIHIIGAGGIGSFLAVALAKLGMQNITIQDFDCVEPHNIPNQLFRLTDIGKMKVDAVKEIASEFGDIEIKVITDKFEDSLPDLEPGSIVISAVDSMEVRKAIFDAIKDDPMVDLFIDPRIGGCTIRILTVPLSEQDSITKYSNSFYDDENAQELECTARAIIDVGFMVAGLVTGIIRNYIANGKWTHELIYDAHNMLFIKQETE